MHLVETTAVDRGEVRQRVRSTSDLPMKSASFNINDINRRLTNQLDWLRETGPNVVWLPGAQDDGRRLSGASTSEGHAHGKDRPQARWTKPEG
jgi:hypothetical protein